MFVKLLAALIVVAALAAPSNGTAVIGPKPGDDEISARLDRGNPCCRPGQECCKGNWRPCCRR